MVFQKVLTIYVYDAKLIWDESEAADECGEINCRTDSFLFQLSTSLLFGKMLKLFKVINTFRTCSTAFCKNEEFRK